MRAVNGQMVLCGILAAVSACAPAAPPVSAPLPVATFDFSPQGCVTPGSNKLTFAIVAPSWQYKSAMSTAKLTQSAEVIPMQDKFTQALRDDFLELVNCRGFTTKGPFDTFDDMVFPDRDGSNLLLEPVIEASVQYADVEKVAHCKGLRVLMCTADAVSASEPTEYTLKGALVFGGRVTLSLKEPVTNTRMWTKSIDLGTTRVPFQGTTIYSSIGNQGNPSKDIGLLTALTPKLEEVYRTVLRTSDKYLDVNEMKLVSGQAADVKKRGSLRVPPI